MTKEFIKLVVEERVTGHQWLFRFFLGFAGGGFLFTAGK